MNGTKTQLKVADGSADAYVTKPRGSGPWPGVLFFMDALGWRDAMFEMADRLASSGYVVLVPNLFWRAGAPEVFSASGFGDPKIRDRIMGLINQTLPVAMKDAATWLDALGAMGDVKDKNRISTTGYCMGGGLAVQSAVAFPDRIAAALSFHGGGFLTSPEAPVALAKVKARVYCAIAETDQRHTPDVTKALEGALTQAKVPHQLELYAGVAHGFAVPDHSVYDKDAAEKHWDRTAGWLRETYA